MDTPLSRIDLNLLVALRALLELRSVTKAADSLFVTQPAMSKTLQRLRELFDDELFTRSGQGLIPTPKAEALEMPLRDALENLETTVFGDSFDPATATGELQICAPEMIAIRALPTLTSILNRSAPGIKLLTRNLLDDYDDLLMTGKLDFVLHLREPEHPDLIHAEIGSGEPHVWLPARHPLARKKQLSAADLKQMPAVRVFMPDFLPADLDRVTQWFESHGGRYEPIFQTTQLFLAMDVMIRENAFMLGPNSLSDCQLVGKDIATRPLKDASTIRAQPMKLNLIQHRRTTNSALHKWAKGQIFAAYDQEPC